MIRVYYLETVKGEVVKGGGFIHHAILDFEGGLRRLLQDTTPTEHNGLVAAAVSWREADKDEIAKYTKFKTDFPFTPARDLGAEIDSLKIDVAQLKTKVIGI